MVEATKELGTNNDLVIFTTLQSVLATVEKMNETLTMLANLPEIRQSLIQLENITGDLLTNRQEDTVNISQLADLVIRSVDVQESIAERVVITDAKADTIAMGIKGTQATLDTFVGWFTPILDDFRNTSIIPMLERIDGRVSTLLDKHNEILTHADNLKDKIDPMLDKLMTSPIIRMLGVKDND